MIINATTMVLKRRATTKEVMKELLICSRPLRHINNPFLQKKSIYTAKYNKDPENNNKPFKCISTCEHLRSSTYLLVQKRIDILKHPSDLMPNNKRMD